jgi:hypothetical protein
MLNRDSLNDLCFLYERYAAPLYGYILDMVLNEMEASQIFYLSFVYAIRHSDEYEAQKLQPFSWLIRIAVKHINEFKLSSVMQNITRDAIQ